MQYCMDWRSITFDWNQTRAFVVTAEEGSLSAAARALGMTQPTIGRQVSALEDALGVALFERVGHGLSLTPAGTDLLDHARRMADAAQEFALTARGQGAALSGTVTVSASEVVAAYQLPPVVDRIAHSHPDITLDIVATNTQSDLRRHEADIAIRNTRPDQPDLVARKVADVPSRLYGTRSYLEKVRASGARFSVVGFDGTDRLRQALNSVGHDFRPDDFRVLSESHLVGWQMARAGLGLGIMSDPIAAMDDTMVAAFPDITPLSFPVWLVAHRDVRRNARVRLVYDLLADMLATPQAGQGGL